MKKAIYPGSFNPFHVGHVDIVKKALQVYDELEIAVYIKKGTGFTREARVKIIKELLAEKNVDTKRVSVTVFCCG